MRTLDLAVFLGISRKRAVVRDARGMVAEESFERDDAECALKNVTSRQLQPTRPRQADRAVEGAIIFPDLFSYIYKRVVNAVADLPFAERQEPSFGFHGTLGWVFVLDNSLLATGQK